MHPLHQYVGVEHLGPVQVEQGGIVVELARRGEGRQPFDQCCFAELGQAGAISGGHQPC